jgi:hypothetical protein
MPPLLPSAGAKFNTPEVMLAPLVVEVPLIAPTDAIPIKDTPEGHTPDAFGPKIVLVVVLM